MRASIFTALLALACAASPAQAEESLTLDNFREFAIFQQSIDMDNMNQELLEATVFLVTNEQRAAHGLSLVPYHPLLADTARGHAVRMAEHGFFSHHDATDEQRATPSKRARIAGIENPAIAENIYDFIGLQYDGSAVYPMAGRGQFSYTSDGPAIPMHSYLSFADDIVAGWMASPGHRANILHAEALQLGVGIEPYWSEGWPYFKAVQVFQLYHQAVPAFVPAAEARPEEPSASERPAPAESVASEPVASEPVASEPVQAEPVESEPVESEPEQVGGDCGIRS